MLSPPLGAGLHTSRCSPAHCSSGVLSPPLPPAHTLAPSQHHFSHAAQPAALPAASSSHQHHHTPLQPQLPPPQLQNNRRRRRERRREALVQQPLSHSPCLVQASASNPAPPDDDGDDEVPTKFELMQRASSLVSPSRWGASLSGLTLRRPHHPIPAHGQPALQRNHALPHIRPIRMRCWVTGASRP